MVVVLIGIVVDIVLVGLFARWILELLYSS